MMGLDTVDPNGDEAGRCARKTLEEQRKFHTWKATTSTLILDAMESLDEEEAGDITEHFNSSLARRVLDVIRCFVRGSDEDIFINLRSIIETSIELDEEICQQVARIDWHFPRSGVRMPFDPAYMEVEIGAINPQAGQLIGVIIAPLLRKRGKSTGESFDIENVLLKMSVA